ncbi:MAG: hypothetical protein ACK5UE_02740 [Chitinophagales bacterium]|jgi:hypothetical protein
MKNKVEKTFDAVKFMRQQRDLLSEKFSKMTKEEILAFLLVKDKETRLIIKTKH